MKALFCGVVVLLCAHLTVAQRILKGKVTDADSKKPLKGATVRLVDKDTVITTGALGVFQIAVDNSDFIIIECKGYDSFVSQVSKYDSLDVSLPVRVDEMATFNVEKKNAEFPGGMKAFKKYLLDNTQYPPEVKPGMTKGPVVLSFTIGVTGEILAESVEVIKGVSPACDKEAVRLIKASPHWRPASQDKKPVETTLVVEISFKR